MIFFLGLSAHGGLQADIKEGVKNLFHKAQEKAQYYNQKYKIGEKFHDFKNDAGDFIHTHLGEAKKDIGALYTSGKKKARKLKNKIREKIGMEKPRRMPKG